MKFGSTAIVLSLLVMELTACNTFAPAPIETPHQTKTILPTATSVPKLTSTSTETPTPYFTKTAIPFTFVDTQDGKQIINNEYGFTITLPSDVYSLISNPTDDSLLSAQFPQKDLTDGGNIYIYFSVSVEDQMDRCHAALTNSPDSPVKTEQIILGGTPFTKVYTPDLDKHELQALEYMTYTDDSCVHFFIGLVMYYFDRGDAEPGNMLPYVEDELDNVISTFEWVKQ